MNSWLLPLSFPVASWHNERLPAPDRELVHAPDHPAQGVVCQRPDRFHPVPFPYFLPAVKDGVPRNRPVDDFSRRPPGQQLTGANFLAVPGCVCPFRPGNGLPVTSGHQNKPFPGGGCAVVRRHQLPMFDFVSQIRELLFPFPEGMSSLGLHRLSLPHRSPGLKFLHILQHDHPGTNQRGPPQNNPGKAPDIPVNQRRPLGLGKMLAVRAEPCQSHGPSPTHFHRVNIPDTCLKMLRVRMVRFVQENGIRVMVDGNGHRTPAGQFNPG